MLPLFIEIPSLWRGDTNSFLNMGLYFSSIAFTVMTLSYGFYGSHYSAPIYSPLILNLVLISYSLKNEYKLNIN